MCHHEFMLFYGIGGMLSSSTLYLVGKIMVLAIFSFLALDINLDLDITRQHLKTTLRHNCGRSHSLKGSSIQGSPWISE
jgi:hypothetical protein